MNKIVFLVVALKTVTSQQDFTITPVNSSAGLYYEKIGKVLLSNNNWEFVTSINYRGYITFYQYIQEQGQKLQEFCNVYKIENCKDR